MKKLVASGNIENTCDATAELCLRYKVDKMTGDPCVLRKDPLLFDKKK